VDEPVSRPRKNPALSPLIIFGAVAAVGYFLWKRMGEKAKPPPLPPSSSSSEPGWTPIYQWQWKTIKFLGVDKQTQVCVNTRTGETMDDASYCSHINRWTNR
jgi:hypothetical protein